MELEGGGTARIQIGDTTTFAEPVYEIGESLVGVKVAAGVEIPLGKAWFGEVAVEYADYGSQSLRLRPGSSSTIEPRRLPREIDVQQSGVRFALGYSF